MWFDEIKKNVFFEEKPNIDRANHMWDELEK